MSDLRVQLPVKLRSAVLVVPFDFTSLMQVPQGEMITSQVVQAEVYSGTDANPASLISGAANVSGYVVSQRLDQGVSGVIYELVCTANTNLAQVLVLRGYLVVVERLP